MAGSNLQYQGKAFVRVNGQEYPTLDGATFTIGGQQRSPVIGYKVYGFKETPLQATVQATFPNHATLSLADINGMVDVTIIFETDIGSRFLLSRAWNTGQSTLSGGGDISTTFEATEAQAL
ncbi:Phage tail tube protein [Leminorella richardii]|uniref:Phage tail tube protein n=1 Tax=Leminorella richardii TaxID=158841 RepID=A0A2X4UH71_9GAMM|nr:phage tail tube protein [Leminorella richardii]SQI34938.1 Phage tail tube protein [Leminorella richardii]